MFCFLSAVAASAIFLSLAVAAHAVDDPRYVPLCAHTAPDGTQLELFGVTDAERGISDIVAVVKKDGAEERTPLMGYDPRYEPELAPAAPTGGSPDEVLLRVFAGGGSGVHIEELYLLRPHIGDGDGGLGVFPFEHDLLTRLASELVDIRAEGGKVSFVRSEKTGDAGSVLFSVDAADPVVLGDSGDRESVFSSQVRYLWGSDGRAAVRISPVLKCAQEPTDEDEPFPYELFCDETIEFDVHVIADTDGEISFSLSDPRVVKE